MRFLELIGLLVSLVIFWFFTFTLYGLNHGSKDNAKITKTEYIINEEKILDDVLNIEKIIKQSNNYNDFTISNVSFEKSKSGDRFYGTVFSFSKDYEKNENNITLNMFKNSDLPEFKKQCVLFFEKIETKTYSENGVNYKIKLYFLDFPNTHYQYDSNDIQTYCSLLESSTPAYLTLGREVL